MTRRLRRALLYGALSNNSPQMRDCLSSASQVCDNPPMKQVVIRGGNVEIVEVPAPQLSSGQVLVETLYSCISAGTEAATLHNAQNTVIDTLTNHPQRIKRAAEILQQDGLGPLVSTIKNRTQALTLTGYSCAGRVIDKDPRITELGVGDLVACAGAEHAHHAEIVAVPFNLVVRVPDSVDARLAATTTIGAIALQGVRRANLRIGEQALIVGLGLVGQITAQLLMASGVDVIGIDLERSRAQLAQQGGVQRALHGDLLDHIHTIHTLTQTQGVDAAIITAATKSSTVLNDAMHCCRKKGKVVVVGDVGMNIDRDAMYAKELDLLISTSYGPGRYDSRYEQDGIDYPYAHVRWTENRNMQAYLALLAQGKIALDHLPDSTYALNDAALAFAALDDDTPPLLTSLKYDAPDFVEKMRRTAQVSHVLSRSDTTQAALIGPGQFAQSKTLPIVTNFQNVQLRYIVGRSGAMTQQTAVRYNSLFATTDIEEVLADEALDCVLITTRHRSHGALVLKALCAGKHVFVEKPLALHENELQAIEEYFRQHQQPPLLMTGYNRRFTPMIESLRSDLTSRHTPVQITYTMNVGAVEPNHWTLGPDGGGRNLGEACHIYDLFLYLVGAPVVACYAQGVPHAAHHPSDSNFVATLTHEDGSVCTLAYNTLGHRDMPKEMLQAHYDNKSIVIDDYLTTRTYGGGPPSRRLKKQDKGHKLALTRFFATITEGGDWPIPLTDQVEVSRVALNIQTMLTNPTSETAS